MITRPKLPIRKGVLGTRLRPPSENKDSTIRPGGKVDTIAVFDLYLIILYTFSLLISYLTWYFFSTFKIANNFKGSVVYMVEDETGKYWETKACASRDLRSIIHILSFHFMKCYYFMFYQQAVPQKFLGLFIKLIFNINNNIPYKYVPIIPLQYKMIKLKSETGLTYLMKKLR